MAAKFANKFNDPKQVIVVEPNEVIFSFVIDIRNIKRRTEHFKLFTRAICDYHFQIHYYQPLFTLIGGGIKSFDQAKRPMRNVLPKNATWLQENVMSFDPEQNQVTMSNGDTAQYEIMIVAMGLQLHWEKVRLEEIFYIFRLVNRN